MSELIWTAERPTGPGWYWAIPKLTGGTTWKNGPVAEIVLLSDDGNIYCTGDDLTRGTGNFTHWLGPLAEPELPEPK